MMYGRTLVFKSLGRSFRFPSSFPKPFLRPYLRLPQTLQSTQTARRYAHQIPKPPRQANPAEEKPRKLLEPHYELTCTCVPCSSRSTHTVSKQGYHKGSVLITCPSCRNRHVISDHLNIFGNRKVTVEDLMRERGELVKRGTLGEDGDVEFWEDGTVTQRGHGPKEHEKGTQVPTHPISAAPAAPLATPSTRPQLTSTATSTTSSTRRQYSTPTNKTKQMPSLMHRHSEERGPTLHRRVSNELSASQQEPLIQKHIDLLRREMMYPKKSIKKSNADQTEIIPETEKVPQNKGQEGLREESVRIKKIGMESLLTQSEIRKWQERERIASGAQRTWLSRTAQPKPPYLGGKNAKLGPEEKPKVVGRDPEERLKTAFASSDSISRKMEVNKVAEGEFEQRPEWEFEEMFKTTSPVPFRKIPVELPWIPPPHIPIANPSTRDINAFNNSNQWTSGDQSQSRLPTYLGIPSPPSVEAPTLTLTNRELDIVFTSPNQLTSGDQGEKFKRTKAMLKANAAATSIVPREGLEHRIVKGKKHLPLFARRVMSTPKPFEGVDYYSNDPPPGSTVPLPPAPPRSSFEEKFGVPHNEISRQPRRRTPPAQKVSWIYAWPPGATEPVKIPKVVVSGRFGRPRRAARARFI